MDAHPSKNPRKARGRSRDSQEITAPMGHIFIAEGLVSKKTGGKKAPLSCRECRRLKLKCDRTFPCVSCKKRGCAEICPEGVLVSGKGTRFILANTEQLHKKIMEMSDRIRQLEDALEVLQSSYSSEPHALMHPNFLNIKSAVGLYGGAQTGTDTSAPASEIGNDDVKPSYTDSDNMDIDSPDQGAGESFKQVARTSYNFLPEAPGQLPAEIIRLSHIFPMSETISPEPNPVLRGYIRSMLPSRSEAEYLWDQARQNALWQYNPHNNETFMPNLLHHVYSSPLDDLCPRRLALLLMILAVGCHVDLSQRGPESPDAEKYHHLARAALCEIPVMEETNVETVTALFYEIWYLLVFSDDKKAAGYAWGLMGLTAKLAQSIGLHRNGVKSKIIPEEVEKRRSLFWELMYLDARLSLSLGRPPSLFLNHMDCKRPSYDLDGGCDPSESLHYYQEWKHSCYVHCLAPVLEVQNRPLDYSIVIDLDKKIRDFSIPPPFRSGVAQSRSLIMQRASLSTALEAVLLQLHRTFFTRALSGPEAFNRSHQYAPSVVAVFLSASRMITTVQDLYHREPQLTARILWYWSNAFSAAVALCLLVSRAPFVCLSSAALQELERARVLFNLAKDICPRALQVIPILETLVEKTNHIYSRWANGQEDPSLVLPRVDDPPAPDSFSVVSRSATDYAKPFMTSPSRPDPFVHAHRSLSHCIEEVHQRGLSLFPTRKPCQCSAATSASCLPSHSWSPPPKFRHPLQVSSSSVLPDLHSGGLTYGVPPPNSSAILPPIAPISPTSRIAVAESLNFDFGALNPGNDPSWMAWF